MQNNTFEHRKGLLIVIIAAVLTAGILSGAAAGYFLREGNKAAVSVSCFILFLIPFISYALYRKLVFPYYRRLEDANLELHLKQEELLDIKDDLFIKFLGVYDVNYAANSPRLFTSRMKEVSDITARVMGADLCLIFLYDKKRDELYLEATNKDRADEVHSVRIPLGEGIEGWVGRRLEPIMLKEMRKDSRFRDIAGQDLSRYLSVYCVPLYVYSSGALVGVMEVLYAKTKSFTDEEINFFTTLSGIISTTVQNEQLQGELNKMNLELEQWVAEKTEELRSSEERYRTLVENACESIFVLSENGDIHFANEQAEHLTGLNKYDLVHKNFFELFVDPTAPKQILSESGQGRQSAKYGHLRRSNDTVVPVDVSAVPLVLMGKKFVQSVVRDISSRLRLEKLLEEKDKEITKLRSGMR